MLMRSWNGSTGSIYVVGNGRALDGLDKGKALGNDTQKISLVSLK